MDSSHSPTGGVLVGGCGDQATDDTQVTGILVLTWRRGRSATHDSDNLMAALDDDVDQADGEPEGKGSLAVATRRAM